jgi:ribosomal protein S18 acetylase RimI-like enzyme
MATAPSSTIRPATQDDVPAILDLYAQTGLDDGIRLSSAQARDMFRRMAAYPYYRLFVVINADGAVTASYGLLIMDNIAHAGAPLSIVEHVAVAVAQQGQGLGQLMMHHAMAESRAHGCYKLALSSNIRRERAHEFYDKLGFVRHGYSFVVDLGSNTPPDMFSD